jgi:tetratricopeptide (TPR) repeat protein
MKLIISKMYTLFHVTLYVTVVCGTMTLTSCIKNIPKQNTSVSIEQKTEFTYKKRFDNTKINSVAISAWKNFHKSRFEEAALDFERLYNKNYIHYDTLFGAGIAYMKYYDLKKSLKFFTLTLKENPNHFEALYFRSQVYKELKNYTAARKDLEHVLLIKNIAPFICGYYMQDVAGSKALKKRHEQAGNMLHAF